MHFALGRPHLARIVCLAAAFVSLLAAPLARAQVTDPKITSWFTANSGKYARIYTTKAAETAGTTATTWSRGQGTQSLPVYSDISEVNYSANWVYIRTANLPSHVMGPWYADAAKTQLFPNYPANRAELYRFPRTPVIPTTKTATSAGTTGKAVNGVSLFDGRDTYSYINSSGADATVGGSSTGDGIWNRDAYHNESVTFDPAFAHQAGSQYHYHAQPIGLRHQLGDNVSYNAATNRYSESPAAASAHSPLLGWARDGLPVYGPYGYSSPLDPASGIRRMVSGFALRDGTLGTTAITVRQILPAWAQRFQNRTTLSASQYGPAVNSTFQLGRYIEDYAYRGDLGQTQGVDFDLNEYNVRWCVTPEYPSGTYAYFTTIKADGTPFYPYITGRQYFGNPTGGTTTATTMNADTPLTRHFSGGPNQTLAITPDPTVSAGVVSVTWAAVEGATYAVAASTDDSAYTTKATDLVATGVTRSTTYTALSTAGTEYTRVTRTALPSYDTNGFSTATVTQTATASFSTGSPNLAPTLTTLANLADGTEDTAYPITYAAIAAAANEADANGDTLSFRVEETFSGILTKNGATVVAGTLLSPGDTFVWTPPGNANGLYTAMTVTAYDGALASPAPLPVQANLSPVNDPPTLASINTLTGATEDTSFTLSYATLASAADEADIDGDTLSFRIESVTTGTLTKNGVAVTPGLTLLSTADSLIWTPAVNANGTLAAFTVKAHDGALASSTAITVNVTIAAVVDGAIWDAGASTGDWSTATNWVDNTLPLATDSVFFPGATPATITLGSDRTLASLSLGGNTAYTFSGNTLTLDSGGTFTTTAPSTGTLTHTVASSLALPGASTFNIAANAALTVSGPLGGAGPLTKTGLGTLTLNGSSSRSGDTTVSEGTLSLSSPTLSATSDLSLDFAAILDLNFSGTMTVARLYIDGALQTKGTWSAPGGGATFTTPFISGAGTLAVTSGAPSFSDFLTTYFTSSEIAAGTLTTLTADPDSDGLANFLEYAFELDPRVSDSSVTSLDASSGHLTLTYPRRTDDIHGELLYIVEVSSDLVTWSSGSTYTEQLSAIPVVGTNHALVTVRDRTALSSAPRRFIRVRIEYD